MEPVTGWAPVTADQYIAPLSKMTYRVVPAPCDSGDLGAPSALFIPPIACHRS